MTTIRVAISAYEAFGWTFEVAFPKEDDGEYIVSISRGHDSGMGDVTVEEGSDLWEELVSALKKTKRYQSWVDDVFADIQCADEDTTDWGDEEGDADE